MFWFERKAEGIEDPKKFSVDVLHEYVRAHAGEGGVQLGDYVADIENDEVKQRFIVAVDELMSEAAEDWIKEELEIAKKVIASKKREAVVYKTASAG